MELEDQVGEALNNAVANGYDFNGWHDLEIAEDLARFDSELEQFEPEDLIEYVRKWRKDDEK